jgi:hypothetical protein
VQIKKYNEILSHTNKDKYWPKNNNNRKQAKIQTQTNFGYNVKKFEALSVVGIMWCM